MENQNSKFISNFVHWAIIFMQPLLKLRKHFEKDGDEIFQYFYFTRNGIEDRFEGAINENSNITVVGKPGQGKTCLIHYIFIELEKKKEIFPIIVDFRELGNDIHRILIEFIENIKKYFELIKFPCNQVTEMANYANCFDQMHLVAKHLENIRKSNLNPTLVIFLDDLDYSPDLYLDVLKKHFISYAASDKAVVVLSVRQVLHNEIISDEELRHRYYIMPKEIKLTDGNLQLIIQKRFISVLKNKKYTSASFISRFRKAFTEDTLDDILIEFAKKNDFDPSSFNDENIPDLPFDNDFYGYLSDIMYFNLRTIEQILPLFIKRELSGKKPSFNENFYDAFIEETADLPLVLLDLISEKTFNNKRNKNGNSIYQNVLEYFHFFENKSNHFYKTMDSLGISREDADKALHNLTLEPHSLIEPKFVYNKDSHKDIYEHYFITEKGTKYVFNILRNNLYFKLKKLTPSNRSYYEERMKLE